MDVRATSAVKPLDYPRDFLRFCEESEWIERNPAKAIKPSRCEYRMLPASRSDAVKPRRKAEGAPQNTSATPTERESKNLNE